MATETLKSLAITNLDASPPVRATAGMGALGRLNTIYATVTPTNGVTTGSIYRLVRIPTTCSVKHLFLDFSGTLTTFTSNLGLYYSDLVIDEVGASAGLTGIVNSQGSLFASAYAWAVATPVDVTNQSASYTPALRNKMIWDVAGLSTDPGGFFDICLTMTATASLSGAVVGCEVQYTLPYA